MPTHLLGFPGGTSGKEPACQCRGCKRCMFDPHLGKIPWRKGWQPTPVFLPGESHGQRRLEGYSPQGPKELDMTEATVRAYACTHAHAHTHTSNLLDETSLGAGLWEI